MSNARLALPTDTYISSDAFNGSVPEVQAFCVYVQVDGGVSENHYVVDAQRHRLDQNMRHAVASYLHQMVADSIVSFILIDLPGMAEVVCDPHGPDSFRPAAAVAVVKATCGWDESNPMIIKVNDCEAAIHLSHDDDLWLATSP